MKYPTPQCPQLPTHTYTSIKLYTFFFRKVLDIPFDLLFTWTQMPDPYGTGNRQCLSPGITLGSVTSLLATMPFN